MSEFIIDGRCPTKGSTKSLDEPDMSRVLDYMRGVLRDQDPSQIVAFVHEGAPVSKARARWSRKGHFYTPGTTQGAEEALSWRFREVVKGRPWKGNIALAAVFFRPNHQRIDADNLMKLVLDAGTKAGVWDDDCQVTHQVSVIEKDVARPRTVIALSAVTGSLNRSDTMDAVCQRCEKSFTRGRADKAKYCSRACRSTPKGMACCPKCDTVFDRKRAGQRYCSDACRVSGVGRRLPAHLQRPPAVCVTCGERVSRREYQFCAKCRRLGRKPGSKNRPKEAQ
jgi:Holliday junction resolvase RusA-like endonuclease